MRTSVKVSKQPCVVVIYHKYQLRHVLPRITSIDKTFSTKLNLKAYSLSEINQNSQKIPALIHMHPLEKYLLYKANHSTLLTTGYILKPLAMHSRPCYSLLNKNNQVFITWNSIRQIQRAENWQAMPREGCFISFSPLQHRIHISSIY